MYTNGGGYDALHGVLSEVEDKGAGICESMHSFFSVLYRITYTICENNDSSVFSMNRNDIYWLCDRFCEQMKQWLFPLLFIRD